MNTKKIFFSLVALIASGVIFYASYQNFLSSSEVSNQNQEVSLIDESEVLSAETSQDETVFIRVNFGSSEVYENSYELNAGDTAFSILRNYADDNGWEIDFEQYDFGVFVKSVSDYVSDSEKAWLYYINGETASVSADNYELEPGDDVLWSYEEVSDEEL